MHSLSGSLSQSEAAVGNASGAWRHSATRIPGSASTDRPPTSTGIGSGARGCGMAPRCAAGSPLAEGSPRPTAPEHGLRHCFMGTIPRRHPGSATRHKPPQMPRRSPSGWHEHAERPGRAPHDRCPVTRAPALLHTPRAACARCNAGTRTQAQRQRPPSRSTVPHKMIYCASQISWRTPCAPTSTEHQLRGPKRPRPRRS